MLRAAKCKSVRLTGVKRGTSREAAVKSVDVKSSCFKRPAEPDVATDRHSDLQKGADVSDKLPLSQDCLRGTACDLDLVWSGLVWSGLVW